MGAPKYGKRQRWNWSGPASSTGRAASLPGEGSTHLRGCGMASSDRIESVIAAVHECPHSGLSDITGLPDDVRSVLGKSSRRAVSRSDFYAMRGPAVTGRTDGLFGVHVLQADLAVPSTG